MLRFFSLEVSGEKANEARDRILAKADKLLENPYIGQHEEYLDHLGQSHRRVIEGHYKIIYKIEGEMIIITDIFDSRQDPSKMKE
jgi:plasmid stabilization system protein ParE